MSRSGGSGILTQVGLKQPATRSGAGPSDTVLVLEARAGQAWAQEALFLRYARMANGLAFRLLGGEADVDDIVQESFACALDGLPRLREPAAFSSWLGAIVVQAAGRTLRRRRLWARLGLRAQAGDGASEGRAGFEAVAKSAPPDVSVELREIYGVVQRLPTEARLALILHRVEGLTVDQIALQMGLSAATVKRRLAAADRVLGRERNALPTQSEERP